MPTRPSPLLPLPCSRSGASARPRARRAIDATLLAAILATGAGCPTTPDVREVDPAYWESRVEAGPDETVITEVVPITDTEENARIRLYESAHQKAVLLAAREILRDDERYRAHEAEIERRLAGQFQQYIVSSRELERARLDGGKALGLKLRVQVARDKVSKLLQEEGILRVDQMRVIVIVRKPQEGSSEVSPLTEGYLDDLGQALAQEMGERGLRPRLWNDVRASLAERRDDLDKDLEDFLVRFVEDSDWRRPEDDRYELPMIVLRSQGRLLCGFRILELAKRELAYHVTMRVDAYDLFKGETLAFDTMSNRAVIGDRTLVATRQQLVTDTARLLVRKLGAKIEEQISREQRLRRHRYKLVFEGYDEHQINRLESLLAGVITEDLNASNVGDRLVVEAELAYEPIPLRDEIARTIKRFGLGAKPARRAGNEITFVREGS